MTNKDVATVLFEISQLLEMQEENIYKIRAYQNAARSIELFPGNIEDLVAVQELQKVPGIGKSISKNIEELVTTGRLTFYEELKGKYPATLAELLKVPNLGPKKIRILFDKLGVASIAQLQKACVENRLVEVKGFGKRTQERILEGIALMSATEGQFLLTHLLPISREILAHLRESKAVIRAEITGSMRRWKEIVKDIDFVVATKEPEKVVDHFQKMPLVARIESKSKTKITARLFTRGVPVELLLVDPSEFAVALQQYTGNREHDSALIRHAKTKGYTLQERGLLKGKKQVTVESEEKLYELLDMDFVPPEMREGLGEVELASQHRLPVAVKLDDIKGIFHVHSLYSDGSNTLEEMIAASRDRGYQFVGISEHSKIAYYAGGLDEARLAEQGREIDALRRKYKDITILKGIEVDILADGSLDMPDEVLANLDFVIASIHSGFKMNETEMTARICRALANPHVDILGHATGRLLLARKGYAVNIEEVLQTARKYEKTIEINASPRRLELDWRLVHHARQLGIRFSINPDAHSISELDYVPYGVAVARKGWATAEDIINASAWPDIKRHFARKSAHRDTKTLR
jgi:DNA polymerase (family X)